MDACRALRRPRAVSGHTGLPGLGRADRPAPGRRAPRTVLAGRRSEHRSAHRRPAARRGFAPGSGSPRSCPSFPVGESSKGGCTTASSRTSSPPTTLRSPTSRTRRGRASSRMLVPTRRTTRRRKPTAAGGRCSRRFDRPFLTAFCDSDPITRVPNGAPVPVPGAAGQEHRPSPARVISSRRTAGPSSQGSSSISWLPLPPTDSASLGSNPQGHDVQDPMSRVTPVRGSRRRGTGGTCRRAGERPRSLRHHR